MGQIPGCHGHGQCLTTPPPPPPYYKSARTHISLLLELKYDGSDLLILFATGPYSVYLITVTLVVLKSFAVCRLLGNTIFIQVLLKESSTINWEIILNFSACKFRFFVSPFKTFR